MSYVMAMRVYELNRNITPLLCRWSTWNSNQNKQEKEKKIRPSIRSCFPLARVIGPIDFAHDLPV